MDHACGERRRRTAGRQARDVSGNAVQRDQPLLLSRWAAAGARRMRGNESDILCGRFPTRRKVADLQQRRRAARWSRTGRELFFRTADNQIAVAAYTVRGDSFVADKPRMWSEKRLANAFNGGMNYSLAPDGKQARRHIHAGRGIRKRRGPEPRYLPRKLLRRAAAQSAREQITTLARSFADFPVKPRSGVGWRDSGCMVGNNRPMS